MDAPPSPTLPPRSPSASDRLTVRTELTRCPFCHDDVDPAGPDWLACRRCLARHHRGCWREGRRCGACGGEQYLGLTVRPSSRIVTWRRSERARRRALRLTLLLVLLVSSALTSALVGTALFDQREHEVNARAALADRRSEILSDHHREQAITLRAELARAHEQLTTLRVESASRARHDQQLADRLRRREEQLQSELDALRERQADRLAALGTVAGSFPVLGRGLAAMERGSYLTALNHFEDAVVERPHDGYIRACRATARHAVGDFDGALVDLDQALMLDPSLLTARYHRAHVLFAQGKLRDAKRELTALQRSLPGDPAADDLRGRARDLAGRIEEEQSATTLRALREVR